MEDQNVVEIMKRCGNDLVYLSEKFNQYDFSMRLIKGEMLKMENLVREKKDELLVIKAQIEETKKMVPSMLALVTEESGKIRAQALKELNEAIAKNEEAEKILDSSKINRGMRGK